jgi:hypothetical protein
LASVENNLSRRYTFRQRIAPPVGACEKPKLFAIWFAERGGDQAYGRAGSGSVPPKIFHSCRFFRAIREIDPLASLVNIPSPVCRLNNGGGASVLDHDSRSHTALGGSRYALRLPLDDLTAQPAHSAAGIRQRNRRRDFAEPDFFGKLSWLEAEKVPRLGRPINLVCDQRHVALRVEAGVSRLEA